MSDTCYNCFLEKPDAGSCPHCGFDGSGEADKYPLALKQGAILNGRYTVGRVLGQGGFGITYLAQDFQTKERVAIKEYLPTEFAGRTQSTQAVQVYSGNRQENFEYGKTLFLSEAKTLAQVQGNEHIVRVFRYFEENNTAYFVMEYVDGPSLAQYMKERGGRLSPEDACSLLLPVMEALDWVHQKGIVHRDIAPDNILIARNGYAKILDFGAARYSTGEKSKSLDVILKHGFAPKEQYQRHGRQGPFTDVYAMAATYYYAITGKTPPDAIDRMEDDTLIPPSTLGVRISDEAEEVLYKALDIIASNRYQSMGQFAAALKAAVGTGVESADTAIPGKAKSQNVEPVSNTAGFLSGPDAADVSTDSKPSGLSPAEPVASKAGNGKKKAPQNKKFIIAVVAAVFLLMAGLGATAERIARNRKTSTPQAAQETTQQAVQSVPDAGSDAVLSTGSEDAVVAGVSRAEHTAMPGGSSLILTTGGPLGTYYVLGKTLAQAVSDVTSTNITAVASNGSVANIHALESGDAQLGFSESGVLFSAYNGDRSFEKPVTDISVVASLYVEQVHIVTFNPDIKTIADLAGKNVSIGSFRSSEYYTATDILNAVGLTEDIDYHAVYQSFAGSVEELKDGRIDACFVTTDAPYQFLADVAQTKDMFLVNLREDEINQIVSVNPSYVPVTIPEGTYRNISDTSTVAVSSVVIASNSVADVDVYNFLFGVYGNLDQLAAVHNMAGELNLDFASSFRGVPYHSGAVQYFAEEGISVPAK